MSDSLPMMHSLVGPYRLDSLIGQGGFGAVYHATHTKMETTVALKVLRRELAESPIGHARFFREARAIASCEHPGIVRIFDAGLDGGWLWLAMERLVGEELAHRIYRSAPLSMEAGFAFAIEICEAVASAHAHGVIHRDLKPSNIFVVDENGQSRIKVLDFGIAKVARPEGGQTIATQTGQALGTPVYMAPEQFYDAKNVDERADVYSLGALLFELFARRTPFDAPTLPEIAFQVTQTGPPPLAKIRTDLPTRASEIVHKAMAMRPGDRFQSVDQMLEALRSPLVQMVRPRRSKSAFSGTMMSVSSPPSPVAIDPFASTTLKETSDT